MRCPQCGKEIDDVSAAQCPSCGMRLTDGDLPIDHQPGAEMERGHAPLAPAPPAGTEYPQHGSPGPEAASAPAGYTPYPSGYVPYPSAPAVAPAQPVGKGRIAVMVTLAVIGVLLIGGGSIAAIVAAAQTAKSHIPAPAALARQTATPTPMATQTSYVIYQNALMAKVAGWANDTHCKFESDGYHIVSQSETYLCFAPTRQLVDVDFSVDVKQVDGSSNVAYGITFRYPRPPAGGSANHYEFGINSYGEWSAWKVINDQVINLSDLATSAAIHPGQMVTNRLRVRTNGEQFDFFVNGTYVGHVDDSRYSNGYVGTIGYVGLRGCAYCDVDFTNISVSPV